MSLLISQKYMDDAKKVKIEKIRTMASVDMKGGMRLGGFEPSAFRSGI